MHGELKGEVGTQQNACDRTDRTLCKKWEIIHGYLAIMDI